MFRLGTSGAGQRGHVSVNRSAQERVILTIGDLRELPQGRAIVFASGTPATLIEPQPWYTSPHAETITNSLHRYGPRSTATAPSPNVGERPVPLGSDWTVEPM